ncbi:STAS domain-containing protein [Kitasatospora sp. NPDC048365]|uniref:STAS domain-containing protein n=1 Tax=Kitasatospora sp. NPDC048365 TaxID=3364050 RepID=UPI00371D284B
MYDRKTAAVVTATGEIDLDTVPALRRQLDAALREHSEVVLDLSGVEFMDCHGLGVIIQARNQADRSGGRLVLRGAGPQVLRLLRLTGAERRLCPAP